MSEEYEGYSNYETFAIGHVIANDEYLYNKYLEIATRAYDNSISISGLEDMIEEEVKEQDKDLFVSLNGEISFFRVNYRELAKDYYEEFDELAQEMQKKHFPEHYNNEGTS